MKAAVYKLICNANSKRCKTMLRAGKGAKIIDDAT